MVGLFFKITMKENKAEYQAGSVLVDDGIQFEIPGWLVKKIRLTIKPLKPGTMVRISQLAGKLEPVNESASMSQELLAKGGNLKIIAGIIAHAIINRRNLKGWKFRYYRWLMLNRVKDLRHLYAYLNIVFRQMSAEHFFFIMALTPAMNYLKRKEGKTEEEKPSGEPLRSSKKPSG